MHETAQRDEKVSSELIPIHPYEPNPSTCAFLVNHRTATQASASVESVADLFAADALMPAGASPGRHLRVRERSSDVATTSAVEYD